MEQLLEKPANVAKSLELGRSTTYELIAEGQIPSIRIRGSIRVPVKALKAWIDQQLDGNSEGGQARDVTEHP